MRLHSETNGIRSVRNGGHDHQMGPRIAPRRLHEAKHQQLIFTLSSVGPHQPPSKALNKSTLSWSYSSGLTELPHLLKSRRFCSRKSCRMIISAVLASVFAISMLISMCSFAQRARHYALFARRRLSDDKSSSSGNLSICGDTEQAGAFFYRKASNTPDPFEESESKPKKAKRDSDQNWDRIEGGPEAPEAPPVVPVPDAPLEGWSLIELCAANALLLLQQEPPCPVQAPIAEKEKQEKQLQTLASSSGIDAPLATPDVQEGDTLLHLFPEPAPITEPLVAAAVPSASGTGFVVEPPEPPPNHPFFRLPTLEPGVTPRPFSTRLAVFYGVRCAEAAALLRDAHSLLTRNTVNQVEANTLMHIAEKLVAHCYRDQTFLFDSQALRSQAEVLGFRYLIFDVLVSIFQVTGQSPPAAWWERFVARVPHSVERLPKKKVRSSFFPHFTEILSEGIAFLKTGTRPSDKQLFQTKYMLFCSKVSMRRFQKPAYDSWRQNCPDTKIDQWSLLAHKFP